MTETPVYVLCRSPQRATAWIKERQASNPIPYPHKIVYVYETSRVYSVPRESKILNTGDFEPRVYAAAKNRALKMSTWADIVKQTP